MLYQKLADSLKVAANKQNETYRHLEALAEQTEDFDIKAELILAKQLVDAGQLDEAIVVLLALDEQVECDGH